MLRGSRGVSLLETDLQLEWQDPAALDVDRARATLGEIAHGFVPDLIHLNGFREATFGWKVPSVVVAHSCVNSWASACGQEGSFTGSEWRLYSSNVQAGLRSATAWVAPTQTFRDHVARRYAPPMKGYAIWNGVDGSRRSSRPKLPFILGAGRVWDKAKNLSALSSTASEIDWPIRIAGPCGLGGETPRPVNGCESLGEISHDELRREMETAAIFVSPALYEPFGLSALEAASAGCALLLSDIPTFRELWDGAAMFFDPRDRRALQACQRSLCGDASSRASLQRAAAERAQLYSLRNTVNCYCALYVSLLASRSGRAGQIERAEMRA
jgi:glycosyltransferase involved in cell wall biosynthesis